VPCALHLTAWGSSGSTAARSRRRFCAKRAQLKYFTDFYLNAKARIWPWLSYLWQRLDNGVGCGLDSIEKQRLQSLKELEAQRARQVPFKDLFSPFLFRGSGSGFHISGTGFRVSTSSRQVVFPPRSNTTSVPLVDPPASIEPLDRHPCTLNPAP